MSSRKSGFSRKLHLAFGTLLFTTLGLAWYFYDSVKWYEYDVQRIALANRVLQGYLEVSDLTFQELHRLGDSLATGQAIDQQRWQEQVLGLREALSFVRQGIGEEVALEGSEQEITELETLEDIERLVEEVIRGSEQVNTALLSGRPELAAPGLERLRSADIVDIFNALIDNALEEQRREARSADEQAIALARYITRALPVFVTILVIVTILFVMFFSGSLTRSVTALQSGAKAFSRGDLSHRIPELGELEFQRLGEAFNAMAHDLLENRTRLHDINVGLEATVEERTRALQSTNQKLAELDAKRRKLLADISHEFRTPLTVMRGEAEIALRGEDKTNESYKEAFQRIMEQADHTTRLVDDLLFIARADAGEPRLKVRTVSLVETLQAVCTSFSARAAQQNMEIEQTYRDAQVMVMGDPGRLRQVFGILIDNALRYSRPGGKVEVGLTVADGEARATVRDHGIGLTEEEAAQAFERFYRGASAEEHARGTGLGLPVAKAIVQAHQGRISLEGKVDEGALATVVLPAKDHLRIVA
jgi:signal transduction histidine kinase